MRFRAGSVAAWLGAALMVVSLHGAARAADSGTFTYSFPADIISLDPQSTRTVYNTNFLANIMEPLARQGADYNPEPVLAMRWENPSPTVWRFFLRPDVKFHTGNPFTANDVVFTIQRAKNPKSPTRGLVINIASVRKIDDLTVDIETTRPCCASCRAS
jgi:peptide/nickel transport system substrate-binding protein